MGERFFCNVNGSSKVFPWKNKGKQHFICFNTEGAEEQVAEEAVAEEDGAEDDAADEVVVDVINQACGAAESVANQVDAEKAANQGSHAGVSE
ncbi:unnamed protein product [Prunus armeniaca]